MGSTHQKDACGSSPLARGLPLRPRRRHGPGGIIPARAGFTQHGSPCWTCPWDHPRSRGVYRLVVGDGRGPAGSSPLARGLRAGRGRQRVPLGIIPARAGFTARRPCSPLPAGDHPRSRGVYACRPFQRVCAPGSSPLARGLLGFGSWFSPPRLDHPRSRGVYRSPTTGRHRAPGSSPLARGLHDGGDVADGGAGIIPARAGFTTSSPGSMSTEADHPRSRGVYVSGDDHEGWRTGSSPLARGLRHQPERGHR